MSIFIMLTKISPGAKSPKSLRRLEMRVNERIKAECPQVDWIYNFAVLGPYDYLDVFQAPDNITAFKVSTIVRAFGHAYTEVWSALEWKSFKEVIEGLSERENSRIAFGEGLGDFHSVAAAPEEQD
jgi:uncharacterized protein with GYD domain